MIKWLFIIIYFFLGKEDVKFWEKSKWELRIVDLRGERDEIESF